MKRGATTVAFRGLLDCLCIAGSGSEPQLAWNYVAAAAGLLVRPSAAVGEALQQPGLEVRLPPILSILMSEPLCVLGTTPTIGTLSGSVGREL
eukprot:s551_g2.t1